MQNTTRRLGAALSGLALGLGALAVAPSAHAAGHDAAPLGQGIDWITGRLTNGVLSTSYGADYSTTGYLALALQRIGGHDAQLGPIVDALESHVAEQVNGFPGGTDVYAGSAAKLAVIVQAAGDDPTDVSGTDVIDVLEGQVKADGRTWDKSDYGDYANTIGQAYAVHALTTAGSPKAAAATDFLLEQQCPGGWFRLSFSAPAAADQSCAADPTSTPDPDSTSFVLLELQGLADTDARVARAIGRAESWLAAQQRPDGSFGGGTSTEGSNANSTGLAGWALGELGHTVVAERAATWLRTLQAHELPACPTKLSSETGAIAYSPAELSKGRAAGVTDAYQWQLALAQSLPLLQWLPTATGSPRLATPAGFQRGRAAATYRVSGAAPAQALCLTAGTAKTAVTAGTDGTATVSSTLPAATSNLPVSLTAASGVVATSTVKVLGAAKPVVRLNATKVKRGKRLTVRVTGLVAGEKVTVKLGRTTVRTGTVGTAGAFTAKVKVAKKQRTGRLKVTVIGQFPDRTGSKTVKVVR